MTFHINNIFTFSKLRIALRENSTENIKDGICQTLKSSKHFITLISMVRTLYFVYIFTPQKSVKKKCTFLCIFSWFYITKNWDPYPVLAVSTSSQNRRPAKPLAVTEKPTRRNPRELTKSGRTGALAGGWLAFTGSNFKRCRWVSLEVPDLVNTTETALIDALIRSWTSFWDLSPSPLQVTSHLAFKP